MSLFSIRYWQIVHCIDVDGGQMVYVSASNNDMSLTVRCGWHCFFLWQKEAGACTDEGKSLLISDTLRLCCKKNDSPDRETIRDLSDIQQAVQLRTSFNLWKYPRVDLCSILTFLEQWFQGLWLCTKSWLDASHHYDSGPSAAPILVFLASMVILKGLCHLIKWVQWILKHR